MSEKLTFGKFISGKRKEHNILAKDIAAKLGISSVYMTDIEKDRRAAPKSESLEIIAEILELSQEERNTMYDLAANAQVNKKGISPDLPDYIMEKDVVRAALRTAKQYDIDDSEWLEFIEKIKKSAKLKP